MLALFGAENQTKTDGEIRFDLRTMLKCEPNMEQNPNYF
jgi:hypothetical protein